MSKKSQETRKEARRKGWTLDRELGQMLEPGSSKRGKLVKNKLIVRFSVADEISFGVIHMCGQSEKRR